MRAAPKVFWISTTAEAAMSMHVETPSRYMGTRLDGGFCCGRKAHTDKCTGEFKECHTLPDRVLEVVDQICQLEIGASSLLYCKRRLKKFFSIGTWVQKQTWTDLGSSRKKKVLGSSWEMRETTLSKRNLFFLPCQCLVRRNQMENLTPSWNKKTGQNGFSRPKSITYLTLSLIYP
jgi:hypothetical protein